jgi:hypothetical protein
VSDVYDEVSCLLRSWLCAIFDRFAPYEIRGGEAYVVWALAGFAIAC